MNLRSSNFDSNHVRCLDMPHVTHVSFCLVVLGPGMIITDKGSPVIRRCILRAAHILDDVRLRTRAAINFIDSGKCRSSQTQSRDYHLLLSCEAWKSYLSRERRHQLMTSSSLYFELSKNGRWR